MTNVTPVPAVSFGDRAWHATIGSKWGNMLLKVGLLGLAMLPLTSHAASRGPGGDFSQIGSTLGGLFCSFIKSPIIAVILGVAILGLLIMAALNEDNGMLSKFLKTVVAGVIILFIPAFLNMIGFEFSACS